MPRSALPAVLANQALRRVLVDDPGAWWVACFAVDRRQRTSGVATALLDAAVAHARVMAQAPSRDIRSTPTPCTRSASERFGPVHRHHAHVLANGFTEIGRTYPSRPVMRLEL